MENQVSPLVFPALNSDSQFSDFRADHVAIQTTEYQALIDWYTTTLDMRLVREWVVGETQLAFLALPNDNHFMIEVLGIQSGEGQDNSAALGYRHLCIQVADLDRTVDVLKRRNVGLLRSFPVPAIGRRIAFIADPFGNTIEFYDNMQ